MSKHYYRTKFNHSESRSDYNKSILNFYYPDYWDEGWYHTQRKRGTSNYWKCKSLFQYEVRMYKTWKHNRKTQWK